MREAQGIAAMFPMVRIEGIGDWAARAAVADDELPEPAIDEALELVDPAELRRVVSSMAGPYADRWESLTNAAGDVAAAERALLSGAVRIAVDEFRPTSREVIEPLEHGWRAAPGSAVLGLVIPPMLVWSLDEARAAAAAAEGRKAAARVRAVQEVALALATYDHVRRLRALADRLADELPFEGLPAASRALRTACRAVADDLDAAREAAALLLVAYVEQRAAAVSAVRS